MKKIKVCMPIYSFCSYYGGAEKQAEKLSADLSKLGVEVTIITTKAKDVSREIISEHGTNIVFLPCLYKGSATILKKLNSFAYLLTLFFYLICNSSKFDILQSFFVNKHTAIIVLCALLTRKPVIIREANISESDKNKQNYRKSLIQKTLYSLYRKSSAFVALTEEIKEEFIEKYKFDEKKVSLIPNGVIIPDKISREDARNKLKISLDSKIAINVAKLHKQKNHKKLFDAWKIVADTMPDAILLCLGDGYEKKNYENYIKEIGCENNIILVGTTDSIADYYQAADLFILPSSYEGMSNAILEAMSYKGLCLASNIRANRFLINDNENGFLFDLDINDEELANIISSLISNSENYSLIRTNALLKAEKHSINNIAKTYYALYDSLLNNFK